MELIVFEDVYKYYGSTPALRGASFTVPRGSLTGLLGPNGSGKTTSLKLVLGVLKPSKGRVLVGGAEPWRRESEVRSMIGFLPEKPVYPTTVTVGALLSHVARLRGLGVRDAMRTAKLVGLEAYWDKRVSALSRGYLQRLGLAQALIGEPELLLLDEPTANLDPRARREILELIRNVKRDLGATVVVSSHILPELQEVVDRVVFLVKGVVAEQGSVEELCSRYGVRLVYRVHVVSDERLVARTLLEGEGVAGVVLHDGWVEVHVDAGRERDFEELVEELRSRGLVTSADRLRSYLGDLYEKVVGVVEG